MASLYEILDDAHDGAALSAIGSEFGLSPIQAEAAVTALLPAISTGLKRSTATPDGLGNLFSMIVIFGSPEVSRAVVDQAQRFSGVSSDVLKKMLPVLAGILVSGLMRSRSTGMSTAPSSPEPSGGNLGDILGQIFKRGMPGSTTAPVPPGQQSPVPGNQPAPPSPSSGEQSAPDGDLLGPILRELEKGIREGRIKPVVIGGGPVQIPQPGGQQGPASSGPDAPQMPGGDVFGKILRDILGSAAAGPAQMPQGRQGQSPQLKDLSDLTSQLGVMGGAGAAVFGDHLEPGQDVEQRHVDNIQNVFDRFFGTPKR